MACNNCNNYNNVSPCVDGCSQHVVLVSCSNCQYTLNTDCVIWNKEVLEAEPTSVVPNSGRTLTQIIRNLDQKGEPTRSSKFITGDYTIEDGDENHILLFQGFTNSSSGSTTIYTITLPNTTYWIDKQLIFKDITAPYAGKTVVWQFDTDIQYGWVTTQVTDQYLGLISSPDAQHKRLSLRFIKTTPTSYQWIVV